MHGVEYRLTGYYDSLLLNKTFREIIRDPVRDVKIIAEQLSTGDYPSKRIAYEILSEIYTGEYNETTWLLLFSFKGGWCLAAALRAAYLLQLYNISSIIIVLKNINHAVLLVKEPVGDPVILDNEKYYVYINYPAVELPGNLSYSMIDRVFVFKVLGRKTL